MGNNLWSTLDTSLLLQFQGIEVQPGDYYLAVRRSGYGERWDLLLMYPDKTRAAYLDAYETATRPNHLSILHSLTLQFQEVTKSVYLLTISLKSSYPKNAKNSR